MTSSPIAEKVIDSSYPILIVGAGAAGLFAAAQLAEMGLGTSCLLLEKSHKPAAKILISGGGRCNLTHSCFDPLALTHHYPRGQRELLGPFRRFQPQDTLNWFQGHGVETATENDGRIFPLSNRSETIANCLINGALEGGVTLLQGTGVDQIEQKEGFFYLHTAEKIYKSRFVLLSTGSHPSGHRLAASLGHSVESTAPSLFSFHISDFALVEHAGVAAQVAVSLNSDLAPQKGSLLITHQGFSGPAILRASAWGARLLKAANYKMGLWIDWAPEYTPHELLEALLALKAREPHSTLTSGPRLGIARNLFKTLVTGFGLDPHEPVAKLSQAKLRHLATSLKANRYEICGQSTHKQEFVTCGGVNLSEIQFKQFESKIHPGLFFAGEILDIDAITGGFNFQNAWTGGWHVAHAIQKRLDPLP